MNKLSKTQQKVINLARSEVREAKEAKGFEDWYTKHYACYFRNYSPKELAEIWPESYEMAVQVYNGRLNGIVLTQAGGPTIRKLESLGLIKILDDATGTGNYRYDKVLVLDV